MPDKDFTREQEVKKLEFAKYLRSDLERLIQISEKVVERESAMLELSELETGAIEMIQSAAAT